MTRPALTAALLILGACGVDPVRQDQIPPAGDPGKGDQGGRPALTQEVCDDGADNDGNGSIDEGCPCAPGTTVACWPGSLELRDEGRCASGVMTCSGDASTEWGSWGECTDWVGPGMEQCNGVDDDCNGLVDDDPSCHQEPTGECDRDDDCAPGEACANHVCVGSGSLRFTLTWDVPCDMDLHVLTPGGLEIDYRATSGDGGTLDRDDREGTGPENIYWDAAPPSGDYLACVVPFRINGPVNWTLLIDREGLEPQQFQGTSDFTDEPYAAHCAQDSGYDVAGIRMP